MMESPSEEELRVAVLQFLTDHNHLESLERQCLAYTSKHSSISAVRKNKITPDTQTVAEFLPIHVLGENEI